MDQWELTIWLAVVQTVIYSGRILLILRFELVLARLAVATR
jgi:hypothetical protein